MKNLTFLSNLTRKINGDCTSSLVNVSRMSRKRLENVSIKSRLDSVSLVSRQSDLRKFASRIAAVLCLLLILGVGNTWGADIWSEDFGDNGTSNTAFSSATCYSASTSMFTSGHQTTVAENYSGDGKVGKNNVNPSNNTGASGKSAAWYTASSGTNTKILFQASNIDISGYASLALKFNLYRTNGAAATNYITVTYSIDGGASQTLSYTAPSNNSTWTWCNGSLSGTGSSLTITFTQNTTGGFTHRLDDITLSGTASGGSGYSITYECNGATSGCPSNTTGTALPNPLPTPSKTNYTFDGWYTNEGLTTPATAGASLSGNVTLYAKWTCAATLTVNLNTPTHGTYVVHKGNNASGPVVSNGDVLDNCSAQSLYIVFTPDAGYGVTDFTATNKGVQDPATAYITDHVRCDYSAGTKTTDINVTFGKACSTPTISFAEAAITKYMGDDDFTITPTISGNDLEAELTYSSNKTACATVDGSGKVHIVNATGSGSTVTITATLAAASDGDDCQKSVSASYTITILNKVTWMVNDEPTTAGSPTTSVTEGGKVTTLPTAPDGESICDGKEFVGWPCRPSRRR